MRALALLLFAWLLWQAWHRRIRAPRWCAPWCFYAHNGFIGAIIGVIVSVISTVASVVLQVGSLVWNSVNDAIGGLARGLTWLWNGTKKFFDAFGGVLKHLFNDVVGKWLTTIYDAYVRLEAWLSNVFGPIIRVFAKVMQIWRTYIQPYVRLVLNIIQRIRLALKILEALHIKWAQKLDQELQGIEAQIIHNDLVIFGYLQDVANVLNDLVNPLHLLRNNVLVQSVLAALNDLSIALFGTPWSALTGFNAAIAGGTGQTANLQATLRLTASDVMNRTGDAAVIQQQGQAMRAVLFKEWGIKGGIGG
jgi:phage-related protein